MADLNYGIEKAYASSSLFECSGSKSFLDSTVCFETKFLSALFLLDEGADMPSNGHLQA